MRCFLSNKAKKQVDDDHFHVTSDHEGVMQP